MQISSCNLQTGSSVSSYGIFLKVIISESHSQRPQPATIFLLKGNNRNARKRREICSKLTKNAPEQQVNVWASKCYLDSNWHKINSPKFLKESVVKLLYCKGAGILSSCSYKTNWKLSQEDICNQCFSVRHVIATFEDFSYFLRTSNTDNLIRC